MQGAGRGQAERRSGTALAPPERRLLGLLLIASLAVMVVLVIAGVVVERSSGTPLVRVGQAAPDFTLPATTGGDATLSKGGGGPALLAFVPSVLCGYCQDQLRALQQALPALRARQGRVLVISVDTPAVQRTVAEDLGLDYPLLSEAPTVGGHPAGSAYGVYHLAHQDPGPVDANAVFVIDAAGVVRAMKVQPGRLIEADQIVALVERALGPVGGRR